VTRLTGPGHGPRLRDLLAPGTADGPAPAVLLDAAVRVLAGWGWSERPVAVVAVPSRHRPELIASVARHLAQVGRLPWLGPLQLFGEGPRGGAGGNSAFRLAGLWEAFTVPEPLRVALADLDGPVLLVDDLVDSRWTLTVAGRELLLAGARQVLPFALAVAG
jgi:ATP-dependent DNA helicase RecQ